MTAFSGIAQGIGGTVVYARVSRSSVYQFGSFVARSFACRRVAAL